MITISLCMIVRDEEEVLGRCLDSVRKLVDEIIIVDTGSRDRTKEVAAAYTDQIYDFVWIDDFAAARNYAFEKGRMSYLMWLDADDLIPAEEAGKFMEMKERISDKDVIMMPYITAFDENGKASFFYYRERIVKNDAGFLFRGKVHEVIQPSGKIYYSDIPVEHRKLRVKEGGGERNLRIYEKMEKSGEYFDSRALYYYGRELMFHEKYEKGAEILNRFLARPDGWKENKIDAARQLAVCYYGMGEEQKALHSLLCAFEYDVPRGEVCCDLGRHFLDREKYEQAVFWYKQALNAKKAPETGAFVEEDCYGFLPAVSLCVCYDRLGDQKEAERYNELAGSFKPESPYYLSNKKYFEQKAE